MSNNVFKGSGILMRQIAEVYIILQTVKVGLMDEMLYVYVSHYLFPPGWLQITSSSNYLNYRSDQTKADQSRPDLDVEFAGFHRCLDSICAGFHRHLDSICSGFHRHLDSIHLSSQFYDVIVILIIPAFVNY